MRVTCQEQVTANVVVVQVLQRPVPIGDVALRNVSLNATDIGGSAATYVPVVSAHTAVIVFIQA